MMMFTGEAEYLGRTFQEEERAQPKASEGGLGFLMPFFFCRLCKKRSD